MTWPLRKISKPTKPPWRKTYDHSESEAALARAREAVARSGQRAEEARKVASTLREMRERNHFAEAMQALLDGPRPHQG